MYSLRPLFAYLALLLVTLGTLSLASCAHQLGPKMEPSRVVQELGLSGCQVSESIRRYEALDFSDLLGYSNLADSPEWAKAVALRQPGDDLRHVSCKSGDNYFGVFRGHTLLFRFGGMIND